MKLSDRPWVGTYLVRGEDREGPYFYTGKGDPLRAHASLHARRGQTVTILASHVGDSVALIVETAVLQALTAANVRLVNGIGGHGTKQLAPAAALAASLNPLNGSPRRTLTPVEVGPAVVVPLNLIHGHVQGDVRQSVYRQWRMSKEVVHKLRRLISAGVAIRVLAVAPGNVVAASYLLTAVKTFPAGMPAAGLRYFALSVDGHAGRLRGHYSPVTRQVGVRYVTPNGHGARALLALPL